MNLPNHPAGGNEESDGLVDLDQLPSDIFGAPPPYSLLQDLLLRPELLEPPPVVLPRLAWQGRLTLLAAREKAGKSTLVGQAVAALVEGQTFLGEPVRKSKVLWLALDEPLGDLVRRLDDYGATGWVAVMTERPSLVVLEETLTSLGAELLVIDTLLEYGAGDVQDSFSATQWLPVLKSLRGICQRTGAGGILLHHSKKSDGSYRDSSQIGAGVDAIIEMHELATDATLRRCRYRGRLRGEDFAVRFLEGRYALDGGTPTLEMRVLQFVASQPGASFRAVRETVGGRVKDVQAAVKDLLGRHAIVNRGTPEHHQYVIRPPKPATKALPDTSNLTRPGNTSGNTPQVIAGNGGKHSGNTQETGRFPAIQSLAGETLAPDPLLEVVKAATRDAA